MATWSERVAELALSVIRDPAASPAEKAEARAVAVGERLDVSRLSRDERAVLRHLVGRCLDPSIPETPLAKLLERRAEELAAERARRLTISDHLLGIIELDPEGTELRRHLASVMEPGPLDQGEDGDGEAENRKGTGGTGAIGDLSDSTGATHVSPNRGSPTMITL